MSTVDPMKISFEGAGSLLVDVAGPLFSEETQARLLALADTLATHPGLREVVPGMNNLMLVFDPLALDPEGLAETVRRCWPAVAPRPATGRIVEIPVTYGGEGGPDLAELAAAKGMTAADLVALHAAPVYGVAAVGAMPGFVYLSGLDPRLATPRRANPRGAVPVGSVIIGGAQAGIMPITAASGWHMLGHTDFPLFDPAARPPAAFAPGDRLRFVVREIRA